MSTKRLWREARIASGIAKESADTAKRTVETMEATAHRQLRAYVYVKDITHTEVIGVGGVVRAWRFIPVFENSGSSPARRATMHISVEHRADSLPDDFDFPDKWDDGVAHEYQTVFIGPTAMMPGKPVEIHMVDIESIAGRRERTYIYGWIDYNDIIPNTPRHRTEFSFELTIPRPGEPFFALLETRKFNGADDDCYRPPAPYPDAPT